MANLDKKILYLVIFLFALGILLIHLEALREEESREKGKLLQEVGELEDDILRMEYWRSMEGRLLYSHPLKGGVISSKVGFRTNPMGGEGETFHEGEDFPAPIGTPVRAAMSGIVAGHWPEPGRPYPGGGVFRGDPILGGKIILDHGVIDRRGELFTMYGHLSKTAPEVHEGAYIERGQIIGYVGETGIATGPHLHFEVTVSPTRFFKGD